MILMQAILISAVSIGVMVVALNALAKKWFPKVEDKDDYLGGKPKQPNGKLWMD